MNALPSPARRRLLAAAVAVLASRPALGAPASGPDVTALGLGNDLGLLDQDGHPRRLKDLRGKVVLLFFGYTRCPDVCPTTLFRAAQAVRLLGPEEAARVQVLWATIDPERDTAALVGSYVSAFNPAFVGLRGTVAQTDAVTAAFKFRYDITYYRNEVLVSHSPDGYLIDPQGRTRVRVTYDATPEQLAQDVRTALQAR